MDNQDFTREDRYIAAKKRIEEIKGFYAHLVVSIVVIPFLIFINLRFTKDFHWFWFPIFGLGISVVIHWFVVFGYGAIGLGKEWEERKIREMMEEDTTPKYQRDRLNY